jgi:hexulose-6-phosphate isomerase
MGAKDAMKKGICLACVPGADDRERYANAARCGFDGVEVGTLRDGDQRQTHKELAKRHGLAVSSVMNSDHWQYPLSDADPAVRRKSIDGVIASIETAVALGADTVLIVPAVVTADVTYEQACERSAESIRKLLGPAEKSRVALGVENVWNKFLLSPVEFAAYVDGFNSEYVAAYFDVGNIVAYGYPDHWIRALGKRIRKIHVKGFDADRHAFVQLMEGTIDWPRVAAALKEIGYGDYVTAELGPAGADPITGLRRISSEMDRILSMAR